MADALDLPEHLTFPEDDGFDEQLRTELAKPIDHNHEGQIAAFGECVDCAAAAMRPPEPARTPVAALHAPVGHQHPDTARTAAARALPRSGSDREAVLAFIAGRGNEGATDDEIEQALGLPHQTASARRNGLAGDGWIIDSGRRRATRSGRDAIVWVAHSG